MIKIIGAIFVIGLFAVFLLVVVDWLFFEPEPGYSDDPY